MADHHSHQTPDKDAGTGTVLADLDLDKIHEVMLSVAYEAGRMMYDAPIGTLDSIGATTKQNAVDIVTDCDKAVEAMVSSTLRGHYPTFSFMGEETYQPGDKIGLEPTFICDPIDGTTNFLHGFPHACISLGLAVNRQPVIGIVYNPWLDTLYTAIRGQGAYVRAPRPTFGRAPTPTESHDGLLERRLPLKQVPFDDGLSGAVVVTEYGHAREGHNYDLKTRIMTKLAAGPKGQDGKAMVHGVRAVGSAALNICHVATGAVDIYWEGGGWPWDVCAGWVILTEAGGTMVGANPGMWENPLESRLYMAVRPMPEEKAKAVVEEFWALMGDERLDYE